MSRMYKYCVYCCFIHDIHEESKELWEMDEHRESTCVSCGTNVGIKNERHHSNVCVESPLKCNEIMNFEKIMKRCCLHHLLLRLIYSFTSSKDNPSYMNNIYSYLLFLKYYLNYKFINIYIYSYILIIHLYIIYINK